MNTRTSAFRRLAILSLSALAFAACDNKAITPVTPLDPQVTITPASATLQVGQTTTFVGSVSNDTTGTLSGVNYSSSNTAVATVTSAGVVTAVAPGTATIIATSKFRTSRSAAAQVIVNPVVSVVTIALAPSSATLTPGQTVNLVASVGGTTNTAVTYVSSDTSVAKVSTAGVVTATSKNGIAIITATSVQDPTRSASSTITVTGGNGPGTTVIVISPTQAQINVGESITFVATVTGNANTAKTFASSDTSVAKVNATTGVVTATNKAGTVQITATATGDVSKTASATLVVVRPTITVTASPTTVSIAPGQTTTITSTITGGSAADQAAGVTCTVSAADQAVATVTSPGCVITGVAAGQATVVVRSVADPTKTALVTVNVAAVTQPSISIQSVTAGGPPPVAVAPGGTVTGNMTVVLNVSAGSATSIQRVAVRLGGVEACSQTFNPPLAPTQGVASITCVVNTAQLNATTGAAVFQNGTYLLTADAFSTANSTNPVATATYGNVVLANANVVNGSVSYDNSLSDADNTPNANSAIDALGNQWFGGSVTVNATPAIFTGTPAATVVISVDLNCNGVVDAGEPRKTATITNGTASAVFSEAAVAAGTSTGGVDDVQQPAGGAALTGVCYLVSDARAANNTQITIPATNLPAATPAGQRVDNVEPGITGLNGAAVAAFAPAFSAAFITNNNYAGTNTTFSTGSAALTGATAADGGVGGVTHAFFALPAGTDVSSQAAIRTAVASQTAITSASQLPSSTTSNAAYILIERATDALGNTVYRNVGNFGVDLENPTTARDATSILQNGTINAPGDIVVNVSDAYSGPRAVRVRGTIYSVLEVDTDAGTEIQCLTDNAGTVGALPASGVCGTYEVPTVNVGGQTEQATVFTPAPAGNTEGFYVYEISGKDLAGNFGATDTYTTLNDVTAPGAVINIVTFNFGAGTVQLTGQIRENVDLLSYDTRFRYPTLTGTTDLQVPDDVPFTTPTAVDSYGLPLTGVVDVTAASSVTVTDITDQTNVAKIATQYGFGATDVASNFSFTGQAITVVAGPGAGVTPANFNAGFNASGSTNATTIDRNGSAAPTSTTLFTQATVGPTAANPIATLYYYIVNPGVDVTFGTADDYNVLVATQSGTTATVQTGLTDRTYTFSTPITTSVQPRIGTPTTYPMFTIGVNANGSAVMSDVVALTIQD